MDVSHSESRFLIKNLTPFQPSGLLLGKADPRNGPVTFLPSGGFGGFLGKSFQGRSPPKKRWTF